MDPLRDVLALRVCSARPARRRSVCPPHDRTRAGVPSRCARPSGAVAPCAPDRPDNIWDMSPAAVLAVGGPSMRDRRRTTHAAHPSPPRGRRASQATRPQAVARHSAPSTGWVQDRDITTQPRAPRASTPPKSVISHASTLRALFKVLLQAASRSQLCGSNDTKGRFCKLPLYSRIIFGWFVCPSESGATRPNVIGE